MNTLFPKSCGIIKTKKLTIAVALVVAGLLFVYFRIKPFADIGLNLKQVKPCTCSGYLPMKQNNFSSVLKELNDSNIVLQSSCSALATARGPGQKVVSYSLYGPFLSEYYEGLLQQLPRVKEVYKGWIIRVYLDLADTNVQNWACAAACANPHLDLCDINNIPGIGNISKCGGTVWRFMVVGDALVERYIVRDTDSPILQRELDAVQEWFHSGKCFHGMRDHYEHGVPIMGGMWGGCNTKHLRVLQDIRKNLKKFGDNHRQDQQTLQKYLWPHMQKDVLMHDSYLCKNFPGSSPFPTQRVNFTFVGMRTFREKFRNELVEKTCPVECRPQNHKDWTYC